MRKSTVLIAILAIIIIIFAVLYFNSEKERKDIQTRIADIEQKILDDKKREEAKQIEETRINDEYRKILVTTCAEIYIGSISSYMACSLISTSWKSAVDSRYGNIDEAISRVKKVMQEKGLYEQNDDIKSKVDGNMVKLQNPPEKFVLSYKLVLEMYGFYVQLFNQSKSPSGSYISFNQEINKTYSEMERVFNQISVVLPEVKAKVDEEKKNAIL